MSKIELYGREGRRALIERRPIEELCPHKCVLLYREGDLYPVVGWLHDDVLYDDAHTFFVLEEGGTEDDPRRRYPLLRWKPTHFAELPLEARAKKARTG